MKTALVLILLSGIAAAQPTPVDMTNGPPAEPPAPQPQPPVQPQPTPPQPPLPPAGGGGAAAAHGDAWGGGETGRPEGIAFGIGLGYTFMTSWQTPNTTSVRVRFRSGLQLEPIFVLGNQATKTESMGASDKDTTTEFDVAALARLPVVRHGKIELELLGGLGFGTTKTNPDGDDNNTTVSTLNLSWGIAVAYWITPHWNLSMSARNPLIAYTKTSRDMPAPLDEATTTSTSFDIAFAPVVSLMLHLYD